MWSNLNIVQSMHENVKSMVKYLNKLKVEFTCARGVRQGECSSPFLFSMLLHDLEVLYIVMLKALI
jgi:hypothetical protein